MKASNEALARYADHPSAFLAMNTGTDHFTSPRAEGLIAYRREGRYLFQLGGPFAPSESRRALLEDFLGNARLRGLRVMALEVAEPDVELYRAAGFRLNQLGLSYTVDLSRFTLRGKAFVKLRNKIERARRAGVEVLEVGRDIEASAALFDELEQLTSRWLGAKGARKKLLAFLVGELGPATPARRIFVARASDHSILGFVTYVPAYGRYAGLLHDLSRRSPEAPPGVMELVNAVAIERFRSEGIRHLSFGMTPFVGVEAATDSVPGRSRAVSWLVRMLAKHGRAIYPAASQAEYKRKWAPHHVEPEYFAYQGRFRLGALAELLRMTRAV